MKRLILFVVVLLVSTTAWAQFEMGSIVGAVVDQSKGPIVGASVEIRSVDTNVARQLTTSVAGDYNSLPLPPGKYTVTVKQPGFRDRVQEVTLSVGQRMELNFTMELGTVSEQVTVSANTVLIETASSELSNVRPEKEIVDLPLNTRNFTQLVHLAPGVNNRGNSSNSVLQGYTSGRGANGAVINGAPSEQVVYLFDGINEKSDDCVMAESWALFRSYLGHPSVTDFQDLEALAVSWHTRFPMASHIAAQILTQDAGVCYTSAPVDWVSE